MRSQRAFLGSITTVSANTRHLPGSLVGQGTSRLACHLFKRADKPRALRRQATRAPTPTLTRSKRARRRGACGTPGPAGIAGFRTDVRREGLGRVRAGGGAVRHSPGKAVIQSWRMERGGRGIGQDGGVARLIDEAPP